MLSEGRRGIDNVFALRSGQLTMFLDKEAYERAGLVGKPHGVKGKRGNKPRWSTPPISRAPNAIADVASRRDRSYKPIDDHGEEGFRQADLCEQKRLCGAHHLAVLQHLRE